MASILSANPQRILHADRFISARACSTELFSNYDAKSEIFSLNNSLTNLDKLGGSVPSMEENNENNANYTGATQHDENYRMYTTLL